MSLIPIGESPMAILLKICLISPIGRDIRFKPGIVWVRIPNEVPTKSIEPMPQGKRNMVDIFVRLNRGHHPVCEVVNL